MKKFFKTFKFFKNLFKTTVAWFESFFKTAAICSCCKYHICLRPGRTTWAVNDKSPISFFKVSTAVWACQRRSLHWPVILVNFFLLGLGHFHSMCYVSQKLYFTLDIYDKTKALMQTNQHAPAH